MMDNEKCSDLQITSIADAVIKLQELRQSNKNLNEPDIEERFARLSLAFKTDKFTLCKRLDLQLRQRDCAEQDIDRELCALRESLNALNQLCGEEADMRSIITKTQQNVDIVQQATKRMCGRAETYGAIQQEERMNCAFETMLSYVEHLKLLYDKEHMELEEYRRLRAEHTLPPEEQKVAQLPPRSHSLSSSSKPESRTRLLSAMCLLNNNPGESAVNRRSSLPVGTLAAIKSAKQTERRQSQGKQSQLARTESEESTSSKPEADFPSSLEEKSEDESTIKDMM